MILAAPLRRQRALGEVSQAVNSTLELETVLSTIVAKAVQLSGTEAGAIYVFDDQRREFHLRATYGTDKQIALVETFADQASQRWQKYSNENSVLTIQCETGSAPLSRNCSGSIRTKEPPLF
jgi:GAF domain-containing protein